jgi:hypothetical protein
MKTLASAVCFGLLIALLINTGCSEASPRDIRLTHGRAESGDVQPLGDDFLIAPDVTLQGLIFKHNTGGTLQPVPTYAAPNPLTDNIWFLRLRVTPTGGRTPYLPASDRDRGFWEGLWPIGTSTGPDTAVPAQALPGARLTAAVVRTDATGENVETIHAGPVVYLGRISDDGVAPTVFIPDPSFESAPLRWNSANGHDRLITQDGTQSFSGRHALATGPGYPYNAITAAATATVPPAGKTLVFRAWAKAQEPETCRLFVVIDDKRTYSAYHPGNGGWRRLEVTAPVPADFEGNTLTLGLSHQGQPTQPAYFDDAAADLVPQPGP